MPHADQWLLDTEQQITPLARWQKSVDLTAQLFNTPVCLIVQRRSQGHQIAVASRHPANPYSAGALLSACTAALSQRALSNAAMLYFANSSQHPHWLQGAKQTAPSFASLLAIPACWPDGKDFGTLCLLDFAPTHYSAALLGLAEQQKESIETDLLLVQQYDQTRQLAACDEQTGLTNLPGFLTMAGQRVSLARRNREALGLVYLQLNGLNRLREQQGTALAATVLKGVAQTLQLHIRDNDLAARVDDNAFAILTRLKNPQALDQIGQRITSSLPDIIAHSSCDERCWLSYSCQLINNFNQPFEFWLDQAHAAASHSPEQPPLTTP